MFWFIDVGFQVRYQLEKIIYKLKEYLPFTRYGFLCILACLVVLWGCATVPRATNVLASVDGDVITAEDLIYSLNISSNEQMNISGVIQSLVDELLIVQEARRMGMEDYPEMQKKVDAYVLRESVIKLYNDEILEKSLVSGEEVSKLMTKKRSDEYLAELRTEAHIEINLELLMSLELDEKESRQDRFKDKDVLVRVYDTVLSTGEFARMLTPLQIDSREKVLNNWIDIQVVNYEALSRQYELKSDLKVKLRRYKRQVLKKLFANKMIIPEISISREEVADHLNVAGRQEKSQADFEELDAVKQRIQKRIFNKKYNKIYNEYVNRLKKDSNIKVYEEAVELYKARLMK